MDYQAIIDKYIGKEVEAEDPSNKDQCMDWAFSFCDEIGIPRAAIRHLNAYEVFTKPNDLTLKYFDYIPNTPNGVPSPGSFLIFGTGVGPSGHISVVSTGDTNQVKSADQNWNGHQYVEYINHPYDNILGWLTPKSSANQPQDLALNDQTKIPAALLGTTEDLEIQQIRGKLGDLTHLEDQVKQLNSVNAEQADQIASLIDKNSAYATQIGELNKKLTDLQNTPATVIAGPKTAKEAFSLWLSLLFHKT